MGLSQEEHEGNRTIITLFNIAHFYNEYNSQTA